MIRVASLHVYPVKSCRGIDLAEAEVTATGFRHDRRWMVVDADGVFISQRTHPRLARVTTRLTDDTLVLGARGMPEIELPLDEAPSHRRSVRVWRDSCEAFDEGPAPQGWFSELLCTHCFLVRMADNHGRPVDRRYAGEGSVGFADGFPFLLVSASSVDDLNTRLARPIGVDRFRANIVIEGAPPYAEDDWSSIEISDVVFDAVKPCSRCVIVTTDQRDGSKDPEPLRTLATYRSSNAGVTFGVNLVHRESGTVRKGDSVSLHCREEF